MSRISQVFTLYGLNGYMEIIDIIINSFDLDKYSMDIKLILTEALNNAFIHGNKKDCGKPIFLRCVKYQQKIVFEIQDTGGGIGRISLPDRIYDEDILNEGGRGLFLINNYADQVMIEKNKMIITKEID